MDEPYLGQIRWMDTTKLERNWQVCDGWLFTVYMQMALFSILGAAFGGDGRQTFGVPDLRHATAPGATSGSPQRGPPAGTSVPFVDAGGVLSKIAIEQLPDVILPPEGAGGKLRPCICTNGRMPKRL